MHHDFLRTLLCLCLCLMLLAACAPAGTPTAGSGDAGTPHAAPARSAEPTQSDAAAPGPAVPAASDAERAAAPAALPEENQTVVLPDGEAALTLDTEQLSCSAFAADGLAYTVSHTSADDIGVVFAPRLERLTDSGWEWVASEIGFCGTPDSVEAVHTGSILPEWFPALTPGVYRLGFSVAFCGDDVLETRPCLTACFRLTEG